MLEGCLQRGIEAIASPVVRAAAGPTPVAFVENAGASPAVPKPAAAVAEMAGQTVVEASIAPSPAAVVVVVEIAGVAMVGSSPAALVAVIVAATEPTAGPIAGMAATEEEALAGPILAAPARTAAVMAAGAAMAVKVVAVVAGPNRVVPVADPSPVKIVVAAGMIVVVVVVAPTAAPDSRHPCCSSGAGQRQ